MPSQRLEDGSTSSETLFVVDIYAGDIEVLPSKFKLGAGFDEPSSGLFNLANSLLTTQGEGLSFYQEVQMQHTYYTKILINYIGITYHLMKMQAHASAPPPGHQDPTFQ